MLLLSSAKSHFETAPSREREREEGNSRTKVKLFLPFSRTFHQDAPVFITRSATARGSPQRREPRPASPRVNRNPLNLLNLVRNLATVTGALDTIPALLNLCTLNPAGCRVSAAAPGKTEVQRATETAFQASPPSRRRRPRR